MSSFAYDQALIERFPTIRGGVILAQGLSVGPTPPALLAEYQEEQRRAANRIGEAPLAEIPSITAWRRVFSGFGVQPTRYRNAAEALLRRLVKQGDIPSINGLVDIGNLVSIRRALPVAAFDQAGVTGTTTVRLAKGDERFTDLGSDVVTNPEPGEVIFVDETGLVSARRWCWRQSDQAAAGPGTTVALITVEGHHETAEEDVASAVADLEGLLRRYQPDCRLESGLLAPDSPRFTAATV